MLANPKHVVAILPQQNRENDTVSVCVPEKLDYLECLHHKKEYVRVEMINEQYKVNLEARKADAIGAAKAGHH